MEQSTLSDASQSSPTGIHLDKQSSSFEPPPKVTMASAQAQNQANKPIRGAELTARERLLALFDAGTFQEIGALVHHQARHFGMAERRGNGDGIITGFGTVEGRVIYAYSQDRAFMGGSLGKAHGQKMVHLMEMAGKTGAPLVGINDSGGARIQEGVEALAGYGEIFRRNVRYSGVIPQISLLMGPCAGGAVYSPALTDIVLMVERKSFMFVTGPKVVRAVTSEQVDQEQLGGAKVHAEVSGVAHLLASSEREALQMTRTLLGYLPSNNCEAAPLGSRQDPITRKVPELARIVPAETNRAYDVQDVIQQVVDQGSWFELRALFAQNVRIGFARMAGLSVGIVANNPAHLAGVLDIHASRKAARFVRMCNAFGLPIVSFVDVPGFLPGCAQEHGAIIDHGAKLAYAYCEASVPKLTVVLRKAYGGAYIVMGSKHVGADFNLAWPGAEIAVMGGPGAVEILYAKELAHHSQPQVRQAELVSAYQQQFATPQIAAECGFVDGVVEPEETRSALARALLALANKRESLPQRRNGNVPL